MFITKAEVIENYLDFFEVLYDFNRSYVIESSGRIIVTGGLKLSSSVYDDVSLPPHLVVCGGMDLSCSCISVPDYLTVLGNLDLRYNNSTHSPVNLIVSDNLLLHNSSLSELSVSAYVGGSVMR